LNAREVGTFSISVVATAAEAADQENGEEDAKDQTREETDKYGWSGKLTAIRVSSCDLT